MFLTYCYGNTQLASDRKSLLCPESGVMFGVLESCKLNIVNFDEYIEDILTRILCGEEVDASFLPCDYVRHFEDGMDAEVAKTPQAVA